MLSHLSISNYTVVDTLELEFAPGMTVITGETGAGKSIMLDALALCLGDRADPKTVRHGAERAEIIAGFDLREVPAAQDWLQERELHTGDECLLRRVVTAEGRSRAYINGSASTLQDCAELGALLVDIHGQHAHQSLLRRPVQRQMLDDYARHTDLSRQVEQLASDWLRCRREFELLSGARDDQTARAQLLAYQVEELEALALQEGELAGLEEEQALLANAEDVLRESHQALELTEAQESGVRRALQLLSGAAHVTAAAGSARELLDSAAIQLAEARGEIQHHIDRVEIDPERLATVRLRLEAIYDVARKHRVLPEALPELSARLAQELDEAAGSGQRIDELAAEMEALTARYAAQAGQLSDARREAAARLVAGGAELLKSLAMGHCRLEIALTPRDSADPHPQGDEEVEFLVSTNPGQPAQPLGRIASGGELSRVSLAIQVVTASNGMVPSMVFDEVDVGIGGAVAEVVGRLLRTLAARAQVLCVTHLPQVAAQGHQHLLVSKTIDADAVSTHLTRLEGEEKIREIARMLGGVKITAQTVAHAREMLEQREAAGTESA